MMRMLAVTVLTIIGNALGIWITSLLVPGFTLGARGFTMTVLFFTVAQIILAPLIFKIAVNHMPALRGGIQLVTIFVVLVLTVWFTKALTISGIAAWVVSPLIIWVVTLVAGVLLPMVLFKKTLQRAGSR